MDTPNRPLATIERDDAGKPVRLKCPHCGNDGEKGRIVHSEWVPSDRIVDGFNDQGVLCIEGASKYFDEGFKDDHFECQAEGCWKEFEIPEGLEIDWI